MKTKFPPLPEGAAWGCLKLERSHYLKRTVIIGPGVKEEVRVVQYWLRCDCGRVVKILENRFKGKRAMRDCGRCGSGKFHDAGANLSLRLPVTLAQMVKDYAYENGMTVSKAVVRLCEGYDREWDWKDWDGRTEMPLECWKFGVLVRDLKVLLRVTLPVRLARQLQRAGVLYGRSVNQIVTGLVQRGLKGPGEVNLVQKEYQRLEMESDEGMVEYGGEINRGRITQ